MTRSTPQRIETFHNAIRQYNTSQERERRLKHVAKSDSTTTMDTPGPLKNKMLLLDVITRWNSLVLMLRRAYELKGV